jgi:RNA polymerase primary sigma factor
MKQLRISKQITNRENESLDRYLVEIGRIDLISADDEASYAKRIREGDLVALEKLTRANLRFVVSVAKQYQNRGLSLSDLINEGNLGLIKAGQRFDETRGFKFISYAVWWIRQSILQALAEQVRIVRLPLNRVSEIHRISSVLSKLEQEFQREPTIQEIADASDVSSEDVGQALSSPGRGISVDAPFASGEESSLLDVIHDENNPMPDESLMQDSLRKEVARLIGTLNARECEVLTLYFGLNGCKAMSLEDIGDHIGLTRERVRQIKEKGIRSLRNTGSKAGLNTYL